MAQQEPIPGMNAYREEVGAAAATEEQRAGRLEAEASQQQAQQVDLAERFTDAEQPFTQEPTHEQIQNVMSGAPWLFALTALGGAAAKLNGQAMLDGLNGLSDGIIKGDAAGMDQAWKAYNAQYEKWKAREDQKFRIYSVLSNAYGSAGDAKLRAMTAAMAMTNDATEKRLQLDDPMKLAEMKAKIEEAHAKTAEAYARAKSLGAAGDDRVRGVKAALYEAGVKLPSSRGTNIDQTIKGMIEKHPTETDEEIVARVREGNIGMAADTTAARKAGGIAGGVGVGLKEVEKFSTNVLSSAHAVPRTSWLPINQLLQAQETQIQDPALRKLKIDINEMMNAYDVVAARGHTDVAKRAEARALITSADSYETLVVAVNEFKLLTQEAQEAAQEYIHEAASGAASGGKTSRSTKKDTEGRPIYLWPDGKYHYSPPS